jgi:hypothetical protein
MPVALNKENLYYLIREVLWLAITAMLIYAVLYPVTSKIYYLYWKINALYIFIAFTYFRYSVSFRSLPFLRPSWVRFVLFAVNLSLFIFLANYEQRLISLADNFYLEDFGFPKVFITDVMKRSFFKYLYSEIVLFGTASLITLSAFQIRLIVSYWQYYKHRANILLED